MKNIIIGVASIGVIIGGICWLSPTAKYTVKGQVIKIENAVQLNNAIEILEAKNVEMQEKYMNLCTGISQTEHQIKQMQNRADNAKAKSQTDLNVQKYTMCTNAVEKLTVAKSKLVEVRCKMRENIIKHRSQIELLRAKLVYLESLKSVNSYLKDVNIDGEFSTGINVIVEEAISAEEAVSEALTDMSSLKTEMNDL